MGVFVTSLRVSSSDGIHALAGVAVVPQGKPRAILHIVHGMTEHISRYTPTMRALAEKGVLCVGYDNLGHGYTAKEGEHGFIAEKDGHMLLAKDVALFAAAVKARYGENIPYILMGHSMGSFIVRLAAANTFRPDKLIVMGTGGKNPLSGVALALIAMNQKRYGAKHYSPFLDKLAFGGYNDRFKGEGGERNLWITTLPEVRKKYAADSLCSFRFCVSAMGDLIRLSKETNEAKWYKNLDKAIPILLVSGGEDPVGKFGKGVREVYDKLVSTGHNAKIKLYEGARHEILNDFCREAVVSDLLAFIDEK
ncbi:MAG: alpha/beta hydrolase [Ruminococcaceae bacterium]|nr:alpha/beta hydrolase [Oscillospiraceae bacterium]